MKRITLKNVDWVLWINGDYIGFKNDFSTNIIPHKDFTDEQGHELRAYINMVFRMMAEVGKLEGQDLK